jgi:hypothetical protein
MIEHYVTIALSEPLHRWFAEHATAQGKPVNQAVQVAVECYADSMEEQRRRDDRVYDRLKVPKKDRVY